MTPTMLPAITKRLTRHADELASDANWLDEYARRLDVNAPEANAARAVWAAVRLLRTAAKETERRE
jgi:hypothetical protein